ncbi:MAG TPA: helix-turn-helix domain-containing protein [Solirubrobacteraceae bacterium]|jgi:excisionase family DNA binding protein|nr:helix-turn-helix domain-containing protein [Solirubrobacteraceae bacterium]
MAEDRVPLFVRLPREQAVALDRLADSTGARKQHLVSELLAGQLAVGRAEIIESAGAEEVLTLQETAELLRLPVETVRASALAGELPGRVFGDEWRFARAAVLAWLAGGDTAQHEVGPRSGSERE